MKLSHLLAAATLSLASFGASADVLTQLAPQTATGQSFDFVFNGLSGPFTGGATLTFLARGDYSPGYSGKGNPVEVAYGSAEGIDFGVLGHDSADTRTFYNFDDTEWATSFALSHDQLVALLADGILTVNLRLDDDVDLWDPDNAYAAVSLEYSPGATSVPEPASLALFGLALAGIGAMRRRRK